MLKYLCIHGHFYQPPRENPWIEEIEVQDSAAPYHDWNERIAIECYRPNTAARLVDAKNRITGIINNYSMLSFNVGPTLLSWLRKKMPDTYNQIIKADKDSKEKNNGHGNAIAQVYNHIIMPLASHHDKVTQVKWGIKDFLYHFGRRPEGMWLAETAVDTETLSVLADEGIKFTILSPFQAMKCRLSPEAEWLDVTGGKIDTTRAYRYNLPNGKEIYLFFYDGNLARGVAFENFLSDSQVLVDAIKKSFPADGEHSLVHYATDGESYGHHFRFGEMALAAAFHKLEKEGEISITNYANYLDLFPVHAEVKIIERSSWSCAHGVERWRADCGCRIGSHPDWNQKWRKPLRDGLDRLRDQLAEFYVQKMSFFTDDPWRIRNSYIDLILNPDLKSGFFQENFDRELTEQDKHHVLQLLEMQRCSMLMFTSCGWFFDEISGIETVQILRYAARAIQLALDAGAPSYLEEDFLRALEEAPSNVPKYRNGLGVYNQEVRPAITDQKRLTAHYGIILSATDEKRDKIFCYHFDNRDYEPFGGSPVPCFISRVTCRDERTEKKEEFILSVAHFDGLDFRCSIVPFTDTDDYERIKYELRERLQGASVSELIHFMDEYFGRDYFTVADCFLDERRILAKKISNRSIESFLNFHRVYYEENKHLMMYLKRINVPVPEDFLLSAKKALSYKLKNEALRAMEEKDLDFIKRILDEARKWSIDLEVSDVEDMIGNTFLDKLEKCTYSFSSDFIRDIDLLIELCNMLDKKPNLWQLQNIFYDMYSAILTRDIVLDAEAELFIERLKDFLNFDLTTIAMEGVKQNNGDS